MAYLRGVMMVEQMAQLKVGMKAEKKAGWMVVMKIEEMVQSRVG